MASPCQSIFLGIIISKMCFNAFGLGALNIYYIVIGGLIALMNVLPMRVSSSKSFSYGLC